MLQSIKYIEVENIDQHPDNPRKELGDLTELAESIRTKGILQNLTVVPSGERYTVIIGHRRLAAAKLAGLKEVPCVISDMDHKEQVATMLLENMQRSDLSAYEQAQGFQMMLNLGETMDGISQKTGFSKTTVRHRVKLMELDQTKLKESSARGATLTDFMELEKIDDVDTRNRVLEKIGTPNFNAELQRALNDQKYKKKLEEIAAEIDKFATKVETANNLQYCKSYYSTFNNKVEAPDDADTVEYFYTASNYGVTLYKKDTKASADATADAQKQKETQDRHVALEEVSKRAYELRLNFIKKFTGAKKHTADLMEFAVQKGLEGYSSVDSDLLADVLNMKFDENNDDSVSFANIVKQTKAPVETIFAVAVYSMLDDSRASYYSWNNEYKSNDDLDTAYDFLKRLGYEMSDEEIALQNGTHKLFKHNEKKTDVA